MQSLPWRRYRPVLRLAVLTVVVSAGLSFPPEGPGNELRALARPRSNIVLILTDDQRWDTLSWMPHVRSELGARGVTFDNAFVVNPLCCPSRTSILTGQYSHSTGVWSNIAPHGGFTAFHDSSTIATRLHRAGYRTALIGKYLNEYENVAYRGYVPPGWDRWAATTRHGEYYDYDLTINGRIVRRGSAPADYATDVLTDKAVSFIRTTTGPFFLYFAPTAPHDPYIPGPRDRTACSNLPPFQPPSFGEASIDDKPAYIQNAPWEPSRAGTARWVRTAQCRTLVAVDRSVHRIVAALSAAGRLSNTMIVFMSDNGFQWGEHRLVEKSVPYEESIRVPLVIRFDALGSHARIEHRFALNIDLAPTFATLAGTTVPGAAGRSLVPILGGRSASWRNSFLIEHAHGSEENPAVPDYCGIRSAGWKYVLYRTGAQELYDLRDDPYELTNVAARSDQAARIRDLKAQVMARCRPLPPGFR